jgi:chitinase
MISQGVLVNDGVPGVYVGAGDWTEEFDEGTVTPYVWNNVTGEFITYDDPVSISYKRESALSVGMQGMMVWEVAYDTDQGELMQYMN